MILSEVLVAEQIRVERWLGLPRAVDGLFDGCVKEDLTSMSFRFLFLRKERRGGAGKTGLILGYSESIFL